MLGIQFESLNLGSGEDVREYRICKMPPAMGGRFAARFAKVIAPAISENREKITSMIRSSMGSEEESQGVEELIGENLDAIVDMLSGAVSSVDMDKLYDLGIEALQYESYAGGRKMTKDDTGQRHFNQWFTEHPADLFKVMAFAIRVNVSGFFAIGGQN